MYTSASGDGGSAATSSGAAGGGEAGGVDGDGATNPFHGASGFAASAATHGAQPCSS